MGHALPATKRVSVASGVATTERNRRSEAKDLTNQLRHVAPFFTIRTIGGGMKCDRPLLSLKSVLKHLQHEFHDGVNNFKISFCQL